MFLFKMATGQLVKSGKRESGALKVEDKKGKKDRTDSAKTSKSDVKGGHEFFIE